jgi:L-rhamnose-H+ transport protein
MPNRKGRIVAANPFVGVAYHWAGGLAAASFYIPYKAVKHWSWETYWLVGGFVSWIIAPLLLAWLLVPDLGHILRSVPSNTILWTFFFGVLWGIGGLTFGLTMRYLGIALGYAVALGLCAVFGTLVPPIFHGEMGQLLQASAGRVTLLGIAVCVVGIVLSGMAGTSKESELTADQKESSVREFNFIKGMAVAIFAGVMSAAMAFGLDAGKPIADAAAQQLSAHDRSDIWQGLPVLIVVLLGGFATNFVWCVVLNLKNRSGSQYLALHDRGRAVPLVTNYFMSGLAGLTWYFQFFFYTMGSTKMGRYGFSSWTLHMASIIIFSTLWGIALHEWKGTSRRTHVLIALGLVVLIGSTVIIGYGNLLKTSG